MSESNSRKFYFVKPSTPVGAIDRYADPAPDVHLFHRTSWEWLFERLMRRINLLSLVGSQGPLDEYFASWESAVRLRRLVPGVSLAADTPPADPDGPSYGFLSLRSGAEPAFRADSLYSAVMPVGHARIVGGSPWLYSSASCLAYGPHDLGAMALSLAADDTTIISAAYSTLDTVRSGFRAPGSTPSEDPEDLYWHVDSEAEFPPGSVSSAVSSPSGVPPAAWRVRTTCSRGQPSLSRYPVFRMLADRRLDDPPVGMDVPVWVSASGRLEDRRGMFAAVRDPMTFDESPVSGVVAAWGARDGGSGAPCRIEAGLSGLSASLAPRCVARVGLPDSYEGQGPVLSFGLAPSDPDDPGSGLMPVYESGFDVGAAIGAPAPARGGPGLVGTGVSPYYADRADGVRARASLLASDALAVHPAADWGDDHRPTYWAAEGFPRLRAGAERSPLRRQLEALCLAQPGIPGWVLSDVRQLPPPAASPAGPADRIASLYGSWFRGVWHPRDPGARRTPVPVPDEPGEISRMLDRLTSTVHPVPLVSASVHVRSLLKAKWTGAYEFESAGLEERSTTVSTYEAETRLDGGVATASLADLIEYGLGRVPAAADTNGGVPPPAAGPWPGTARREWSSDWRVAGVRASLDPELATRASSEEVEWTVEASLSRLVPLGMSPSGYDPDAFADSRWGLRLSGFRRRSVEQESESTDRAVSSVPVASSYSSETSDSGDHGEEACPDLPPDALPMLRRDLLRWVKSASLYLVTEATVRARGGTVETVVRTGQGSGPGDFASASSGTASGEAVHACRRNVIRLGALDLETGALSGTVDLANLARRVFPEPDPTATLDVRESLLDPTVNSSVSDGRAPVTTSSLTEYGQVPGDPPSRYLKSEKTIVSETDLPSYDFFVRSAKLYLVVDWDFDAEDPPRPSPGPSDMRYVSLLATRQALDLAQAGYPPALGRSGQAAAVLAALSADLDASAALLSSGGASTVRDALVAVVSSLQSDLETARAAGDRQAEASVLLAIADARRELSALDRASADARADAQAAIADAQAAIADAQAAIADVDTAVEAAKSAVAAAVAAVSGNAADALSRVSAARSAAEAALAALRSVESLLSDADGLLSAASRAAYRAKLAVYSAADA